MLSCTQVHVAARHGVVGLVLYTDPADYSIDPHVATFPASWWLPGTGVQRGNAHTADGDVLTPFYPSIGQYCYLLYIATVVTEPAIRQSGFALSRHTWSLINRFRTGQGPCRANLHKWGLAQSPSCDCGQRQTVNHIVDTSPLAKFEAGLNLLHKADDDAVTWLESKASAALAK